MSGRMPHPRPGKEKRSMQLLNTDILYEDLLEDGFSVSLHRCGQARPLRGYRFYMPGETADPSLLYICPANEPSAAPDPEWAGTVLYCGDWETAALPAESLWYLCPGGNVRELINFLEELFSRYRSTDAAMELAMVSSGTLDRICAIASDYFGVFCFVHDEQFCLIGYDRRLDPAYLDGFEYAEEYGCYIQASSILNDFRTNPEYQRTLHTGGCQLWVDPTSDERCLYMNLFLSGHYHGRFLVTVKELTAGRTAAVEYFGQALLEALTTEPLAAISQGNLITRLLRRCAAGEPLSEQSLAAVERKAGWPLHGSYVCGLVRLYDNQLNNYLLRSVCSGILDKVPGSALYASENHIYVLVNLQIAQLRPSDIRVNMSELIRESLLKAGLSDEFETLRDFPVFMAQASACLDYMEQAQMTDWFGEFRQIAVPFWLRNGAAHLDGRALTARAIRLLQRYDALNETDLCETLKVYLSNERNATVTSTLLRIHRSTLPHRLARIEEITGINLEEAGTRLHLLMSFAWMDAAITAQ